jgi:hypothetical protein
LAIFMGGLPTASPPSSSSLGEGGGQGDRSAVSVRRSVGWSGRMNACSPVRVGYMSCMRGAFPGAIFLGGEGCCCVGRVVPAVRARVLPSASVSVGPIHVWNPIDWSIAFRATARVLIWWIGELSVGGSWLFTVSRGYRWEDCVQTPLLRVGPPGGLGGAEGGCSSRHGRWLGQSGGNAVASVGGRFRLLSDACREAGSIRNP